MQLRRLTVLLLAILGATEMSAARCACQDTVAADAPQRALSLAESLAEHGLMELSVEAATRAFSHGVTVSRDTAVGDTPSDAETARVLLRLLHAWHDQGVSTEQLSLVLREAVLPTNRPTAVRILPWPVSDTGAGIGRRTGSAAEACIQSAVAADSLPQLVAEVSLRPESAPREFLNTLIAIGIESDAAVATSLRALADSGKQPSGLLSEPFTRVISYPYVSEQAPGPAAMLLEQAADFRAHADQERPPGHSADPSRGFRRRTGTSGTGYRPSSTAPDDVNRRRSGVRRLMLSAIDLRLQAEQPDKAASMLRQAMSSEESGIGIPDAARLLLRRGLASEFTSVTGAVPSDYAGFYCSLPATDGSQQQPSDREDTETAASPTVPESRDTASRPVRFRFGDDAATDSDRRRFVIEEYSAEGSSQGLVTSIEGAATIRSADAVISGADGGLLLALEIVPEGSPVTSGGRIYVVDPAAGSALLLCEGALPSFSPRGNRLVCSRFAPARGVWLLRSDGTEAELLDSVGWGATWSSDGRLIAWNYRGSPETPVAVRDVAEDRLDVYPMAGGPRPGIQLPLWWSSDGQSLWCTSGDGDRAVLCLDRRRRREEALAVPRLPPETGDIRSVQTASGLPTVVLTGDTDDGQVWVIGPEDRNQISSPGSGIRAVTGITDQGTFFVVRSSD